MDLSALCDSLAIPIGVTVISSLLIYIAVSVYAMLKNQDKINRVLFGEEPWEGLIKIVVDDRAKLELLQSHCTQISYIMKDSGITDERLNKIISCLNDS